MYHDLTVGHQKGLVEEESLYQDLDPDHDLDHILAVDLDHLMTENNDMVAEADQEADHQCHQESVMLEVGRHPQLVNVLVYLV